MGEVRVERVVDAPVAEVWDVLSHVDGWSEWNDVMTDARCDRGEVGAVISLRVKVGPVHLPIKARLTAWAPHRELAWGEDRGRLLRIEHGLQLHPAAGGTRVVHFERFGGVVGRLVYRVVHRSLERDYARFLDELKARVEARTT